MTTTRILSTVLATLAIVTAGCGGGSSSSNDNSSGAAQVLPVQANPIHNAAKGAGLRIDSVLVENNVDPATHKDAPDHLEIQLENTAKHSLRGIEVFYEITDPTTGDHEGYYRRLGALSIAPGSKRTVHFDDTGAPYHYPDNPYSLYHSSKDALKVRVTVSARGVGVQSATVKKDAGGDENPDE
jgi:hypothetical protein